MWPSTGSLMRLLAMTPSKRSEAPPAARAMWAGDPAIRAVVVRGAGTRAYCAGGDIRGIWEGGRIPEGSADGRASELFRREYMLIRRIKVFPKPYVALIGGIAMENDPPRRATGWQTPPGSHYR